MTLAYIYALREPDGRVRYIGKSVCPKNRRLAHLSKSANKNPYLRRWIEKMIAARTPPEMVILAACDVRDWELHERLWIARGHKLGWKLTNATDGGMVMPECTIAALHASERWQAQKRAAQYRRLKKVAAHPLGRSSSVKSVEAMARRATRMMGVQRHIAHLERTNRPRFDRWLKRNEWYFNAPLRLLEAIFGNPPARTFQPL